MDDTIKRPLYVYINKKGELALSQVFPKDGYRTVIGIVEMLVMGVTRLPEADVQKWVDEAIAELRMK